jgi:integrase
MSAEILDADGPGRLAATMGPCGPMVYLGAFGLRWGEIAGLRVGQLDFLRHTFTIDRQRTRGEKGRMVEGEPKSKAGRRPSLALPGWLMGILADLLAVRGLTGGDPDVRMFASPEGAPLQYSNWRRRVWLPSREAAGFPGLDFHDLKKTAGTALIDEGVNVRTAQARLGHADPKTTLTISPKLRNGPIGMQPTG